MASFFTKALWVAGVCLAVANPRPATAADEEPRTSVRLVWENDKFDLFGDNSDRWYTNGMRLEYERAGASVDASFLPAVNHRDWCAVFCSGNPDAAAYAGGVTIGQNMYTPDIISKRENQPFDRPYAGVLYIARHAAATFPTRDGGGRQDRVELRVGIVGPASLAGPLQRWWHSKFDDWVQPAGWRNQLRNEPIVQGQYASARRFPVAGGRHLDIIPRVRVNLGNELVSAEAEATVRVGWGLQGFGAPPPQPAPAFAPVSRELSALAGGTRGILRSFNLFVRANPKAVAHSIYLDGNFFARNDIRIARKPFVMEWAAGAEAHLFWRIWASYQYIHRSSEFSRGKLGDASAQKFGSAAVGVRW